MNAVASRNIKFISHSDQGGRGDGVQIMVHRGYAYIGHGYSNGITVLDVRDLKNPKPVAFLPCPPDTRAIHLQTHDDLLLAVNGPSMWTMQVDAQAYYSGSPADLLQGRQYTAGVRIYDIAHPEATREIAFMATEGVGPHRIWYVGGRYAYVSIHYLEFTDQVLAIADVAEPTRPEVVGKWWIPLSTAVSFTGGTDGFESVFPQRQVRRNLKVILAGMFPISMQTAKPVHCRISGRTTASRRPRRASRRPCWLGPPGWRIWREGPLCGGAPAAARRRGGRRFPRRRGAGPCAGLPRRCARCRRRAPARAGRRSPPPARHGRRRCHASRRKTARR